jgi:aconitate hydratase
MLTIAPRARHALRSVRRFAARMATVAPRIGDTKVPMSLLEKGAYINYQRIEDNLAIVRERCSDPLHYLSDVLLMPPRGLGCAAH